MFHHQILFKQSVKNMGFTLDCHLSMNAHVSNIARTCYFELRRLASIHCSALAPVHSGVPRGSVLGPMPFTMYTKLLSAIFDSHSIIHHSFADDLQLQISTPPDGLSELFHAMQSCIGDV